MGKEGVCSGGAAAYGGRPPRRHLRPPPVSVGEEGRSKREERAQKVKREKFLL